jgi:hypothetical protein
MAGGEYDSKTYARNKEEERRVRKGPAAFTEVKYSEPGI